MAATLVNICFNLKLQAAPGTPATWSSVLDGNFKVVRSLGWLEGCSRALGRNAIH